MHPELKRELGPLGWASRHRRCSWLSARAADALPLHGSFDFTSISSLRRLLRRCSSTLCTCARPNLASACSAAIARGAGVLFNSYVFLFAFLPVVLAGWWGFGLPRRPARVPHARLVFLLRLVGLAVPAADARLDDGRLRRRRARSRRDDEPTPRGRPGRGAHCRTSAMLGYFKYAGFFVDSLDGIGSTLGLGAPFPELASFCRSASRSTRSTRCRTRSTSSGGASEPARSLLHYAAFVSLFPHLIAGPIVRFSTIAGSCAAAPRLHVGARRRRARSSSLRPREEAPDRRPARTARRPRSSPTTPTSASSPAGRRRSATRFSSTSTSRATPTWRSGSRSCSASVPAELQLAVQGGEHLGLLAPLAHEAVVWFRDYLFIPLGGSRAGTSDGLATCSSTMFLGGLWHGAAWTFVVWGLVHGALLDRPRRAASRRPDAAAARSSTASITFACVVAAFVIFRAPSLHVAGDVLSRDGRRSTGSERRRRSTRSAVPSGCSASRRCSSSCNLAPNTWEVEFRPRRSTASRSAARWQPRC